MKTRLTSCAALMVALAGCNDTGEESQVEHLTTIDMAETESFAAEDAAMEPPPPPSMSGMGSRPGIPVTMPKIAYIYDYGYRLDGESIAPLQQKHADMCSAMGPYSCQIVSLSHSGAEAEYMTGKLELAVVAEKAREFGKRLGTAAGEAEAEETSSTIQGEDLSKAIVDTEARLRSRVVLRDRLLEVLRTRRGKVSELVEAERSVAQVNEEIDRARSWLEEMKGRVAYSRINISYGSANAVPGGFAAPVRSAFGSLSSLFGVMLAALIYMLAVAGPLLLAVLGIRAVLRRLPEKSAPAEA